jgi:hypothetical protein
MNRDAAEQILGPFERRVQRVRCTWKIIYIRGYEHRCRLAEGRVAPLRRSKERPEDEAPYVLIMFRQALAKSRRR